VAISRSEKCRIGLSCALLTNESRLWHFSNASRLTIFFYSCPQSNPLIRNMIGLLVAVSFPRLTHAAQKPMKNMDSRPVPIWENGPKLPPARTHFWLRRRFAGHHSATPRRSPPAIDKAVYGPHYFESSAGSESHDPLCFVDCAVAVLQG